MSNVISRYRKISQMEYFQNAVGLQEEMTKFLLREKNVPRKYRATVTYPVIARWDEFFQLVKRANKIYTDTEEKVAERKAIQQECVDKIDDIYWELQKTVSILWRDALRAKEPTADSERIRNALNSFALGLKREESLLVGWKIATHLVKPRGPTT